MKFIKFAVCFAFSAALYAQETQLGADFRREGERLKESCSGFSFGKIGGCAQVLFTDHPLHIAVGSLAPQNGFGFGPAFTGHWTPNETWRLNFDMDAVATTSQSWRAGAYMTAVLVRRRTIVPTLGTAGTPGSTKKSNLHELEYSVFHVYAQSISLNKLSYFGLGPNTKDTARAYFGMRETILGTNVVWPINGLKKLNASVFGEINGRFVDLRASNGHASPSIEKLYSDITAPGLVRQPGAAQFGEGIRFRPTLVDDYIRLNYSFTYQQYVASDAVFSFQRFTTDLSHQFPIYKKTRTLLPKDSNGPDNCSSDSTGGAAGKYNCPAVTRDLEGGFGFRFLLSESLIPSGHVVPFYFQQTLGGSDINGHNAISAYQDYRFRAPNLMLIRGSFEHSLPGRFSPLGVAFAADAGKVALKHSDLGSSPFVHSYSAGLTLRAGGFPQIYLLFAWGGNEGTHTIGAINTSLLGGSARPSLY